MKDQARSTQDPGLRMDNPGAKTEEQGRRPQHGVAQDPGPTMDNPRAKTEEQG